MLKIKINRNNTVLTADRLSLKKIEINGNDILFETNILYKLKNNDKIKFQNKIGASIFMDEKYITVNDDFNFKTPNFAPYSLFLSNVKKILLPNKWKGQKKDALLLTFSKPHDFIKNRNKIFVKKVLNDENEIVDDLKVGDFVLCYDSYLYVIDDSKSLSPNYENMNAQIYTKINGINEKINCIVPIGIDGLDNQYNLLCFYDDNNNNVIDFLNKNNSFTPITREDRRFTYFDENNDLQIQKTVEIYKLTGNYHVEIPSSNLFSTNLYQTDIVEKDFVEKETQKAINPIVNMEKYSFSPVCINTGETVDFPESFLPITEIEFNLHFRDRTNSENWLTDDSKYWNSYDVDEGGKLIYRGASSSATTSNRFFSIEQSDLLGYLNFTNQDVLYQKSKLKKSFIRLSFYDKRDIKTQKLLYYSTIFIDSGTLFGKYTNNIDTEGYVSSGGTSGVTGIGVYNEYNPSGVTKNVNENKRLSSRLTIKDKYNSTASSEGFYLYLFAETAPKYEPKPLYMKVEFNHAGYGRTVPFVMPTNDKNIPYNPVKNDGFPKTYTEEKEVIGEDGKPMGFNEIKVNMERLYEDMFIELNVKYDDEKNQYVWFLPRSFGLYNGSNGTTYNGKMVFNLFEPKIQ